MSTHKASNLSWYQRFTYTVVNYTEYIFYTMGYKIGSNPRKTIVYCWIFVFLSSLGFIRFHQEKNPMKLWVPPNTRFIKDTQWLTQKFQIGYRPQVVQIIAEDVLTTEVLKYLLEIHNMVNTRRTLNNVTWNDVCFKMPKVDEGLIRLLEGSKKKQNNVTEKELIVTMNAVLYCSFVETMQKECFEKNILDLWDYDKAVINQLTKDDIIDTLNRYNENPVMGHIKIYDDLLGGIERNNTGHIVSARSIQSFWMIMVNLTTVDMDKTGNIAGTADWASPAVLEWESEFLKTMHEFKYSNNNLTLYYMASRSFGDISNATMFQDIDILCIGIFIMVIYVQFVISKFNWIEARVTLGCIGLLTVGMSFVVACGLCSLFGISYGPVHTSLPFLLMGLGVDDMFVIMACWNDLTRDQKILSVPERMGLMLKHAGVSITVTSVTDVLAFVIGSSTILPSLQSYCIYAAFGVSMTFIFAVSFFTACFVLDQARIDKNRNGIIVCYTHNAFEPNECSQQDISNKVFRCIYNNIILTNAGKVLVVVTTAICFGFSIESARHLEQRFDPSWLIPQNTYFSEYIQVRKLYFPTNGFEGGIYMGSVNYSEEIFNIKSMVDKLYGEENIISNIVSWVDPFLQYVQTNFHSEFYTDTLSDEHFNLYLSMFLFSPRTAVYQANFRFEKPLECGVPAPKIIMSSIDFRFKYFSVSGEYLPAMHRVQDIAHNLNFTTGDKFATAWSKIFATWVTDEVIETEVMRNLQLTLLCVMTCTAVLIADVQICFWIFICVLLTMINVCGFMQRWGLTIDLVSCIGLELAIGLCVDYATHIGHTFLTIRDGTKKERSLKAVTTIGSAVFYGGFSTLIGVFMLSQSEAYIFQSFFKIFFLVISFGLFHGIVFLPVILSCLGPKPYSVSGKIVEQGEIEIT